MGVIVVCIFTAQSRLDVLHFLLSGWSTATLMHMVASPTAPHTCPVVSHRVSVTQAVHGLTGVPQHVMVNAAGFTVTGPDHSGEDQHPTSPTMS